MVDTGTYFSFFFVFFFFVFFFSLFFSFFSFVFMFCPICYLIVVIDCPPYKSLLKNNQVCLKAWKHPRTCNKNYNILQFTGRSKITRGNERSVCSFNCFNIHFNISNNKWNDVGLNVRKRTFEYVRQANMTKTYLCNFDLLKPHFY